MREQSNTSDVSLSRPVIFSAPMVRSILSGCKRMTRRVVVPQPINNRVGMVNAAYCGQPDVWLVDGAVSEYHDRGVRLPGWACPYGIPGDVLWVRETWSAPHAYDHMPPRFIPGSTRFHYAATEERGGLLWRPSIHMPRLASRIILKITNMRVERIQNISEEDAIAEGVELWGLDWPADHYHHAEAQKSIDYKNYLWHGCTSSSLVKTWAYQYSNYSTAKGSFSSLWESINGKRPGCSWADNPWVWVVGFEWVQA